MAAQSQRDVRGSTSAEIHAIRPFRVNVPEAASPTSPPHQRDQVAGPGNGERMRRKACSSRRCRNSRSYWANEHDWRKCEAKLNALPHFITEIDGLDIHFIHVRSKHENALPMIVTHGWPGSIIEQMKIIEPLTNPTAHGGSAADAFHVVIPSLPGYGFSGKPTTPGWNPVSIAKAWATLMQRLGYTKYVAQGGDWGNAISEVMALQQPPGLLGIHTNMAATVPPDVSKALAAGGPPPAGLSPEEKHAWDQTRRLLQEWAGLRQRNGDSSADALRTRRLADRSRRLDARSRHSQLPDDRSRFRRQARGADARRCPRQRHALLADEHRDLFGASLLGHGA